MYNIQRQDTLFNCVSPVVSVPDVILHLMRYRCLFREKRNLSVFDLQVVVTAVIITKIIIFLNKWYINWQKFYFSWSLRCEIIPLFKQGYWTKPEHGTSQH